VRHSSEQQQQQQAHDLSHFEAIVHLKQSEACKNNSVTASCLACLAAQLHNQGRQPTAFQGLCLLPLLPLLILYCTSQRYCASYAPVRTCMRLVPRPQHCCQPQYTSAPMLHCCQ
jgi:hypothetical protein